MNETEVATLVSSGIWIVVKIVAVLIIPSLLIGLVIATFQAATQINEQTLSFLPRLIATLMMVVVSGHWLIGTIVDFFHYLFSAIPTLVV